MPDDDFHPLADLFPLLADADFDRLVDDIRSHGVREPICRHKDGRIIDGRNRWLACRQLGIECPERTFAGDDEAILPFVVSMNLHRRHLDASQRAMVAARLATLGEGRPSKTPPNDGVSAERAAVLLNVGERSVERARVVLRHGDPELTELVDQGEISVSAAADIARMQEEEGAQLERRARREERDERAASRQRYREIIEKHAYERKVKKARESERGGVVRLQEPPPAADPAETTRNERAHAVYLFLNRSPRILPATAVAAIPVDNRGPYRRMARDHYRWLEEFLRLLEQTDTAKAGGPGE